MFYCAIDLDSNCITTKLTFYRYVSLYSFIQLCKVCKDFEYDSNLQPNFILLVCKIVHSCWRRWEGLKSINTPKWHCMAVVDIAFFFDFISFGVLRYSSLSVFKQWLVQVLFFITVWTGQAFSSWRMCIIMWCLSYTLWSR